MLTDFHYHCIKALCVHAGFAPDEAETIAYASQYVDDATEHKGLRIAQLPACARPLVRRGLFEPVCTAHKLLDLLFHGLSEDAQRKVFIPFHFLPPAPGRRDGTSCFSWRVAPDGAWAGGLLDEALDACRKAAPGDGRQLALVALGIALHVYADTWSHQGFSGCHDAADNDIGSIEALREGAWLDRGAIGQILLDLRPDIGHAEAGDLPDRSDAVWRFVRCGTQAPETRANPAVFLEAAQRAYRRLLRLGGQPSRWEELAPRLVDLFAFSTDDPDEKCRAWRLAFPSIAFAYDATSWRIASLEGDTVEWDGYEATQFLELELRATRDARWFHFHLAAQRYRRAVLSRLPAIAFPRATEAPASVAIRTATGSSRRPPARLPGDAR